MSKDYTNFDQFQLPGRCAMLVKTAWHAVPRQRTRSESMLRLFLHRPAAEFAGLFSLDSEYSCKLIPSNSWIYEEGMVIYFPRQEIPAPISPMPETSGEANGGVAQKLKRRAFLRRRAQSTCDPIIEEEACF